MLPLLHSNYSLLAGTAPVEELVRAAAKFGYARAALTDTDNLYGAVAFAKACREKKITPIVGAELTTTLGIATLLAKDDEGYANLCALITDRHLNEHPVPPDMLAAHARGLVAIAHDTALAPVVHQVFRDDGFLGVVAGTGARAYAAMLDRMALAERNGWHTVGIGPVWFLSPFDHPTHKVLTAIRRNTSVAKLSERDIEPADRYFRSPDEIASCFAPFPELVAATASIADRCAFQFQFGTYHMPRLPLLPSGADPYAALWERAFAGVRERYDPITTDVMQRLTRELDVIHRLGFSAYFLLAHDIVDYCHRHGIPCVGRGSAASSIVSYALGITDICPIQHGLYFERFLNDGRRDPPDIDIDICGRRRDEVLAYVYERYGTDAVAAVCSVVTLQARSAVREVAKAIGLTADEINAVAKRLPHGPLEWALTLLDRRPEGRDMALETEPFKSVIAFCRKIDGFPRHIGMHPCGIVVAPRKLTTLVPLQWVAKGLAVTQCDMYAVDDVGLIKMDLLGQRALTIVSDTLAHIERTTGTRIDLHAIPPDDEPTFRFINEGRTLGIFQLESPGMRTLLKQMKIESVNDVCLGLSVIRPGAADSGSKEQFVKIMNKKAEPVYLHEALRPILGDTLGCVIYQEQVMQIVRQVAGLSLTEADGIRRAMTKQRGKQEMESMRQAFLDGAAPVVGEEIAEKIWDMVARFSGYGYCKAHAMTYAHISYREAYLKLRYPAEYMAAVCSAEAGYYHVSVYVEEAKRLGVRVLLPDVNKSQWLYTVEKNNAMRVGLMQVKNLPRETADAIVAARAQDGFFTSLGEFLERVPIDPSHVESLIKCGAFDAFENTRPELMWKLKLLADRPAVAAGAPPLIAAEPAWGIVPHVPDFDVAKKYRMEFDLLEISVRCHPTELLRSVAGTVPSTEFAKHVGKEIHTVGWIVAYRRTTTKERQEMLFLTCEDRVGIYEVILFPEVCARDGDIMFRSRMVEVTGTVETHGQIVAVRVAPWKK